jgi:polysaccharide biosynthesis transport protein
MNDTADLSNATGATAGRLIPAAQSVPAAREPYRAPGGYPGSVLDAPKEAGLDLFQYWRILNKRRWLIISTIASLVALGTVASLMQTPLYTATVRLQIDRNVAKIVEQGNVTPVEGTDFEFLRTQYELLQSRTMAERVASALKLGNDADFLKPREFSIVGAVMGVLQSSPRPAGEKNDNSALERAAAGLVLANRTVRPVSGSRLVDVTYSDPVGSRAQRIAMAYADAFIASNLDKRFQANAYAKTFLEDQIQQAKLRLEESEKAMLEFAQQEQIVVVTEKSSIAENNLAGANVALANLVSERIKNEQLWRQIEAANAINVPQLLSNSVIENLRGKRQALVIEYQEKLETFKPSFPAMVQINNKIKEIDRQLATEVRTIRNSFKAAYESSLSQEKEMSARIEALRTEVLDLQKRSIQYNILKREVDINRDLHAGLLQRFKEVDVAGGVGANNVFVVDKAVIPSAPSSPNLPRALLLSFALGLGASLAAVAVLERIDDRIGSAEELEEASGLSTLGIIPKVDSKTSVMDELANPRSALCEAYRSLCTALQFSTENGLPKTLSITSATPAEGKSLTSLAIAKHFASLGLKVLVVDADLRNPSLHEKLHHDNSIGLSNYLTGACGTPDAIKPTNFPNLSLITSGPLPPNAAELLGSSRLLSLLSIGSEVFDLIVIDGPPVMGLADAQLLSSAVAATVFIVGAGQVGARLIRGALKRLRLARGPVIGSVLTKFDARTAGYGYGYGYGYGNHGKPSGHSVIESRDRKQQLTNAHENG